MERAIAIWLLAGSKKYPSDHLPVRVGDPDYASAVLCRLNVPPDLTHACIGVMSRTSWPLPIMAPLIWQYVDAQRTKATIRKVEIVPAQEVEGTPLYAMDMFTRSGQASFRQWQKEVSETHNEGYPACTWKTSSTGQPNFERRPHRDALPCAGHHKRPS